MTITRGSPHEQTNREAECCCIAATRQKCAEIKKAGSRSSPERWLILCVKTVIIIFLPSVAHDPEGIQKLDRLRKTTKLAGMTCHLINKVVMMKNCVEALNIIIIILQYYYLVKDIVVGFETCLQ